MRALRRRPLATRKVQRDANNNTRASDIRPRRRNQKAPRSSAREILYDSRRVVRLRRSFSRSFWPLAEIAGLLGSHRRGGCASRHGYDHVRDSARVDRNAAQAPRPPMGSVWEFEAPARNKGEKRRRLGRRAVRDRLSRNDLQPASETPAIKSLQILQQQAIGKEDRHEPRKIGCRQRLQLQRRSHGRER